MPPARRDDCPWCGSKQLRARTRTVDECQDCAHVFQNPQRPVEDRLLEEHVKPCSATRRQHRLTARAMLRLRPEPESWLDVGTRDAGFPETAREVFPYTSFDGLDPSPLVVRARTADRVEEAYVGNLPDPHITTILRGRYDVVSLLNHLHHTSDPRAELQAALTLLRSGGHLVIEAPDPRSALATLLGRRWRPQTHPGHTHLIPQDNLRTELESRGCTLSPPLSRTRFSTTYRLIARKS
ncbi:class I SAM-dependent methyltransferase [Streptomyces sp. GESEQ-4]|uniref:class I SAM-dependent methyltransferase n=1 Tax=Streptomyces sp. GESEQ-4 TaxID=2812655 RepID=UPI001B3242FE|nr:class I SAM-dependent methyltransferase [Streptomyces sp. GESEQ-4]